MSEIHNIYGLSDTALLSMTGNFIKHHRLQQNITQAQLAQAAGINRSTLSEFENGKGITLLTFIQLLRALNLLYTLSQFQVQLQFSPLQLAEMQQEERKRASRQSKKTPRKKSSW